MPALFTRTSSRPSRSSTSAAAAVTLSSSVTSRGTPNASTPAAAQAGHRLVPPRRVACADPDGVAERAEARCDLVPDALVRAGDQGGLRFVHAVHAWRPARRSNTVWCTDPYPRGMDACRRTGLPIVAWTTASCATSSPSPRSCTSAGRPSGWASRSRRCRGPIRQLERRLGAELLAPHQPRRSRSPSAGEVLLREGRAALDAVEAAERRTRRAARSAEGAPGLVLVTKAGASSELLRQAAGRLRRRTRRGPRRGGAVRPGPAGAAAARRARRRGAAAPAVRRHAGSRHRGCWPPRGRSPCSRRATRWRPATELAGRGRTTCRTCRSPRWPAAGRELPRRARARRCATTPSSLQLVALGRTLLVVPDSVRSQLAGGRRRRARRRRAGGHHRDRVAAAQPVARRRRDRADRAPPLIAAPVREGWSSRDMAVAQHTGAVASDRRRHAS